MPRGNQLACEILYPLIRLKEIFTTAPSASKKLFSKVVKSGPKIIKSITLFTEVQSKSLTHSVEKGETPDEKCFPEKTFEVVLESIGLDF